MLSVQKYVKQSLGLHLFYARLMKEHSLFMQELRAYRPVCHLYRGGEYGVERSAEPVGLIVQVGILCGK